MDPAKISLGLQKEVNSTFLNLERSTLDEAPWKLEEEENH